MSRGTGVFGMFAMTTEKTRKAIVDAMMALAAEHEFGVIGLAEVAARAGVSMSALREAYDGKFAILEDVSRRADIAVLAGAAATTEESPRDRLFDVLMRRFDALKPYRAGIAGLLNAARRDLRLAACIHRTGLTSMRWMLEAADIPGSGLRYAAKVEGLFVVYGRALRIWLTDDDADLAKTMAALDRGLRRGESLLQRVESIASVLRPLTPAGWSRARREAEAEVRDSETGAPA